MKSQVFENYKDSLITINYSKAFRIQKDLLTIPFYKAIVFYKDSIIINQKYINNICEENTKLLDTKNKEFKNSIKDKRFKIIKKNITISVLGAFILIQNYYFITKL